MINFNFNKNSHRRIIFGTATCYNILYNCMQSGASRDTYNFFMNVYLKLYKQKNMCSASVISFSFHKNRCKSMILGIIAYSNISHNHTQSGDSRHTYEFPRNFYLKLSKQKVLVGRIWSILISLKIQLYLAQ